MKDMGIGRGRNVFVKAIGLLGAVGAMSLLTVSCTPRVSVDLDPVVEFGIEEQIVPITDTSVNVPIVMSRISSEVVTVWIKYEGHQDHASTISFPAGVSSGEFQVNLKGPGHGALSKEVTLTMTKSSFSKLGKTRVHRIKVQDL